MTALQTVNLGTAPAGSDGDPVRTGFTKANSNVAVLNAQAALTSAAATITTAQALTAALHVGKRVNISLATAGTINLPAASTCAADQVTLLRNIGSTVATLAATSGSGDTVALSKLNPGEAALMDTDGVHAWNVLMRGRTNSDNETVNGNCAVSGNESVGGTLAVTGNTTVGGALGVTGQVTVANDGNLTYAAGNQRGLNWMAGTSIRWRIYTDGVAEAGSNAGSNLAFARYTDAGVYVDNPLAINRASGVFAFTYRPTFAGKTPWDSGNLVNPMTLDTPQNVTGRKNYTAQVAIARPAPDGSWLNAPLVISGYPGVGSIGIGSGSSAVVLRCAATYQALEVVSYDSSVFATIAASAFNVNSDAAIKTQIQTIDCATEKIKRLRGVTYVMKADKQRLSQVGVIAQEVAEAFPEAVSETGMQIDETGASVERGGRPMLSVNYSALIGPLIQAFKELEARVSALEG